MSNDNPVQDTSASQTEATGAVHQMDQIDLERKAEADLEAFAASMLGAETPQNDEVAEPVAQESDEAPDDEEIELSEDEADVDSPDEVEEGEEVDESADQELDILDYDEWSKYALEIGGKTYTGSQLKSALGRLESAGKNAREADQLRKDYEAKNAQLVQKEQQLQQKFQAAGEVDKLAGLRVEAGRLNKAMEKARSEGDMYELSVLKDRKEQLGAAYNKAKHQVDSAKAQMEQQVTLRAEAGLKERGLGYLTEDTPQAKAWISYASSSLSPAEIELASRNPGIAEAIELARKYKTATNKKSKKQLKTSGKTLRPGQNPSKTVTKKQELSGDDYFQALARDMFGS